MHARLWRDVCILSLTALLLAAPLITWRLWAAEAAAQHEARDLASQHGARTDSSIGACPRFFVHNRKEEP
jgi:hypothetical protein